MKSRIMFTVFASIGWMIGTLLGGSEHGAPIAFGGIFCYVISMFFMPNKEPRQ